MAQINLGHVVGQGVPSGGTAGQILKKNGSTNFDTSWATLDGSMVPVSAGDSTTVQQSLAAVKSDMGIVEDGNTATHTIADGQYVIWKGVLTTASTAIPSGTALSSSNLTAVSNGGLNALNGKIENVDSKIEGCAKVSVVSLAANTSKTLSVPTYAYGLIGSVRATDSYSSLVFVSSGTISILKQSSIVTYSLSGETLTITNGASNVSVNIIVVNFNKNAQIE